MRIKTNKRTLVISAIIAAGAWLVFWLVFSFSVFGWIIAFSGSLPILCLLCSKWREKHMTPASPHILTHYIDKLADIIILHDEQGTILACNDRVHEILGYSVENILGKNIVELDSDGFMRRHPQMTLDLNLGQTKIYETIYTKQDGEKLPVEVATRLAEWSELPVYIDVVRDITQRKKELQLSSQSKIELERVRNKLESRMQIRSIELERQIRNRQRAEKDVDAIRHFLSSLIDSMPSAIIAIDKQQQITQWNKAAEDLTHISMSDALNQHLDKLLPEFSPFVSTSIDTIKSGESVAHQRFSASMQNKQHLLDMIVYPLQASIHSGHVIRIDDVTEKVRLEETLIQTEKMLSLGGLAAGMAHEINNPLGAILQSSQNIIRRLDLDRDRNQKVAEELGVSLQVIYDYLEKQRIISFIHGIKTAGERAANIVNDMLSFARPTRGDSIVINLNESLDQSVRLAESDYNQKKQMDFKKIRIVKEYPEQDVHVLGQKNQLQQVFLNLLINAAQAMAGSLKTDNPQIIIRLGIEDHQAVIEFIDNGPGMDDQVRKRIFEPFFTTKEEGQGTGLGLSVSYFIITEQMQGQMEVDTSPGRGTRFIIKLPLSE